MTKSVPQTILRRQCYLERGEEDVGLEEVEALVDDVLLVRSYRGRRWTPAGPLGRDPEREDGHVADELLAVGRDGRVVGRHYGLVGVWPFSR